jgi:hypothetical protein
MFGVNPVMQEAIGFFGREAKDSFRLWSKLMFIPRRCLPPTGAGRFDLLPQILGREVKLREDLAGNATGFAQQTEKQFFALDQRAAELGGFVPSEEQDAARSVCVPFEHRNFF